MQTSPFKPLLALAMIVKDEAATLARTLASVRGIVDVVVVVDTGSSDATREIARQEGAELHERPFVDFATTRNAAIEIAEARARWVLMLSGGETLGEAAGLREVLEASMDEAHSLRVRLGTLIYDSPRVTRSGAGWRYRGVTHEVIVPPSGAGAPATR